LVLFLGVGGGPVSGQAGPLPGPDGQGPASYQVTLVTGDRVLVESHPDGRWSVTVDAARRPGFEPGFQMLEIGDDVYVIPDDAAAYIPEKLDRELFNVTGLIRQGYHDQAVGVIPVIVTYESRSAAGQ